MAQPVSHRDEMEGGLDKDTKWMENIEQSKGIKTIVRKKYYTLDKVLLKVDLQTLRINNIEKVCWITIQTKYGKAFYDYFGSVNVLDFSGLG